MKRSALYTGQVWHARLRPRRHRLRYRVFSLLLDLDELTALDRDLHLFGYNRWALFSFRDCDHGNGEAGALRSWVERQVSEAGVDARQLRIRVLCYPRILGYVFNPLTVFYCEASDGQVRAVLYEVCNTFHERHTYVIPVSGDESGAIRQSCAKELYVSPFVPMDCRYQFNLRPPGESVFVGIEESDRDGRLLTAAFSGKREEISDKRLLITFLRHPLMTVKVMGAIHWEALKIWLKRIPVHRHRPAAMRVASTIVSHLEQKNTENERV
ncbi:DUF1365 domain-containing protein [Rhizobium chutanense]|uniref:DUF1365 domain-containing protein n=1 Tax=Rhizobium chutanense TaxID=2035448 RepID=A0A3S0SST8_9HYPH|nr:DUF1365 family protein [Rhizobium chutanense]RUL99325.1 DUF1365 domain-containing protein [Rhizobium chutanense]